VSGRVGFLAAALLATAGGLFVPSTASPQGVNRCPINIQRAGPRVERPDPEREGAITAFISGPVTITCGDATMTGDSAVWRQVEETGLMIGNVRYRDTTRTLNSERLTFFGARDEVVATGDVRLVRIANGAKLEGPRVSFTRTPFVGSRTVATERPRMTLPATRAGEGAGPQTIVDADVAEFVGESEASASGEVVMTRGAIRATSERASFSETAARAVLYDDAVISGEGFDLAGDSISAGFEFGEIRSIHAFEQATASGRRFRLLAEQIRARLAGDQVEMIWAFGEGRSLASSERLTLAGDSIEFAFIDGVADSVSAIGTAAAEQDMGSTESLPAPPVPVSSPDSILAGPDSLAAAANGLVEPALGIDPGSSWIAGDTVRAWFEPDPTVIGDPATSEGGNSRIRRLRALGDARSFFAAVRDSTRSLDPSRNYLLGGTIQIDFEGGEPQTLSGTDAIGVYLEPAEEGERG
jgi:lipopolysaccharide export system protein LptA